MTDHGRLMDHTTGETIRDATCEDYENSAANTDNGVFKIDRDGIACPVDADETVFGPTRLVWVDQ